MLRFGGLAGQVHHDTLEEISLLKTRVIHDHVLDWLGKPLHQFFLYFTRGLPGI